MEQSYGKGTLVPTGKHAPAMDVRYQISMQSIQVKEPDGSFLRQKAVVHSIAEVAGRHIDLGDFDLLVGDQLVRLKHVDSEPEWLVLSSSASRICQA